MHLPQFIKPQLAALRERPPAGAGWVHEIDLAGYRLQLRVARGTCVLRTRKGRDWTRRFGSLARQLRALPDCIIDGEIMALDQQGAPDFAALQAALAEDRSDSLIFFAFDLLFLGQEDLRRLALSDRKGRLRELLAQHPQLGAAIRYVEHFTSAGDAVLQSACRMSLEGIVSKKLVAPYRSGRGQSWLESRCHTVHEVLIGGWRESAGRLRSLQVGVCQGTHLYHLASVTAGLKGASPRLRSRLTQHEAHRSPFAGRNAPQMARGIHWLEPPLAAEVELTGWSEDGLLRQAALKRLLTGEAASELRGAKPAADRAGVGSRQSAAPRARAVAQPRVAPSPSGPAVVMGVKLTKADKALWPATAGEAAITKLDLARYFEQVGAWMMEHMRGRPCSIIRAPDGIGGQRFFQRHATPGTSSLIELVKIAGDSKPYLQVDRIEGLAALAQVAAVELHPWNSAPGQPEVPGRFVFDLDPAPDVPFERVVEAAIELRQRLENLGLIAFCKTTGGKGLHLVTPFSISRSAAVGWPEAKALAREICVRMAADSPRKYLVTMAKSARTGRIFLDYLRNDRMATAVAPLSPRARSGAPVSMPLKWSQVRRGLNPQRYTVRTVPGLLGSSDAWHDYCECERPLREALKRVGGNMRRRDAQAAARGTPA